MAQPLTEQEKNDMRDILEKFYGPQTKGWGITIRSFELLGEMMRKTSQCNGLMELVPRPLGPGSVVKWGQKQAREFVIRKLKSNEGKHYIICMKTAAYSMKMRFMQAAYGV